MSRLRLGWRGAIYLLLLAVVAVLIVVWWPELSRIWREHLLTFLIAMLFMGVAQVIQARNFIAFMTEPTSISSWQLSRVWALTSLANYAGPFQPGVALRVIYLQRQGVAMTGSLLAMWRQISASVWISTIGLALGFFLVQDARTRLPAVLFLIAAVALFLLRQGLATLLQRLQRPAWLITRRALLVDAVGRIALRGVVGVALQYAIGTFLLLWVYSRFGAEIGLGQALVLACVVYVSTLVAVVPGNLGIMEGIYLIGGHRLGMTVHEAAALAFLLRGAHVASCLVLTASGQSIGWRFQR